MTHFCLLYSWFAPSCTELHRVTLFLIDIILTCTEYHRVTHFCLLYLWFAPSTTELHRVAPSTTELLYFNWYNSYLHRIPPSNSFLLIILMFCTELHRVAPSTTEWLIFAYYTYDLHRVAPSCTVYHRVTLSGFIYFTCTEYHRAIIYCCLGSTTELHRVPPRYYIL